MVLPRPVSAAGLLVPSTALPLVAILEQPFRNSIPTGPNRLQGGPFVGLPSTKAPSYMLNLDDLRVDNFNLGGSVQITSEG